MNLCMLAAFLSVVVVLCIAAGFKNSTDELETFLTVVLALVVLTGLSNSAEELDSANHA